MGFKAERVANSAGFVEEDEQMEIPKEIVEKSQGLENALSARCPALSGLIDRCFRNTAETTLQKDELGFFVITGDIPAMWLRDSAGQVAHYVPLAKDSDTMRNILRGVIERQCFEINLDPYANAFNREPNGRSYDPRDESDRKSAWVWERKFELDSLCAPIFLAFDYYRMTKDGSIFTAGFHRMLENVVKVCKTEQAHASSPYYFRRKSKKATETLAENGRGSPVGETGMIWSGFRPSDDACTYHYLVPANMMAAAALKRAARLVSDGFGDEDLARECIRISGEVDRGIEKFGIVRHPKYGKIYAYETDGLGSYNLMDDANSPNLLSIPFLGYRDISDPIYRNTRKFILSEDNPYYYKGTAATGIGSPHTPSGNVWPMSIVMQALTSDNHHEITDCLNILAHTHAGTGLMHESFDADDPSKFTRPWFAWANSMFSLLIFRLVQNSFPF
jgi:meiotically up-regulated gene 157 (Mug157) protein